MALRGIRKGGASGRGGPALHIDVVLDHKRHPKERQILGGVPFKVIELRLQVLKACAVNPCHIARAVNGQPLRQEGARRHPIALIALEPLDNGEGQID